MGVMVQELPNGDKAYENLMAIALLPLFMGVWYWIPGKYAAKAMLITSIIAFLTSAFVQYKGISRINVSGSGHSNWEMFKKNWLLSVYFFAPVIGHFLELGVWIFMVLQDDPKAVEQKNGEAVKEHKNRARGKRADDKEPKDRADDEEPKGDERV